MTLRLEDSQVPAGRITATTADGGRKINEFVSGSSVLLQEGNMKVNRHCTFQKTLPTDNKTPFIELSGKVLSFL